MVRIEEDCQLGKGVVYVVRAELESKLSALVVSSNTGVGRYG
jgi:hypothetical protein